MKILIRNLNGKEYVWTEAEYVKGEYRVGTPENSISIPITNIVSTDNDNRKKYVVCRGCGELVLNTPKSIEAHYIRNEKKRNCLKCDEIIPKSKKNVIQKIAPNEDGAYKITETYSSDLYCRLSGYRQTLINSTDCNYCCKYLKCRSNGISEISDVFVKYPGLFDTLITADVVIDNGWSYKGTFSPYYRSPQYMYYDGGVRNTLSALVNFSGIVDGFYVKNRGGNCIFYYSAKYDKLFWRDYYNDYREGKPDYMSDSKYASVYKKIKSLYTEVNVNE